MTQIIKSSVSTKMTEYNIIISDKYDLEYDDNHVFYPNDFIELNITVNWEHHMRGTRVVSIIHDDNETLSQSFCPKSLDKHSQYVYFKLLKVKSFHIELFQNSGINLNAGITVNILSHTKSENSNVPKIKVDKKLPVLNRPLKRLVI